MAASRAALDERESALADRSTALDLRETALAEQEAARQSVQGELAEALDVRERRLAIEEETYREKAAELTRNEEALVARMDHLAQQALDIATERERLDARAATMSAGLDESDVADHVTLANELRLLPSPRFGNGIAIIEFDRHLIGVLSAIHESERAVVASQCAGLIREQLSQSGKRALLRDRTLDAPLAVVMLSLDAPADGRPQPGDAGPVIPAPGYRGRRDDVIA